MDRVAGLNWTDIGGGRRGFRGRNAASGLAGTEVTAAWLNAVQEELAALAALAGPLNAMDWTQVTAGIRSGQLNYRVAGGSANALAVALSPPVTSAPPAGLPLRIKISATNTGPATLDAGWGAAPVTKSGAVALDWGDLLAGAVAEVVWIGAGWHLTAARVSPLPRYVEWFSPGSYAWTVPDGVTLAQFDCWGGGGGGGGAYSPGSEAAASGGGGGAFVRRRMSVTPGTTYTIVVGAGGLGGNAAGSNGSPGGSSAVAGIITAGGGGGGGGASNAITASAGSGGTPLGGDIYLFGNPGGTPVYIPGLSLGGSGGASPRGGSGTDGGGQNAPGWTGAIPGSGASGATSSSAGNGFAGGNGAAGAVIVNY